MGFKSLPPQQKLEALTQAACWDIFEGESLLEQKISRCWVYPAAAPGKAVPIFKVLLSSYCIHNCLYCAHRANRPSTRYSFLPEELSQIFGEMHRRGMVEGIFLSSAVDKSPTATMEKLLKTAEIIREKYHFKGYFHLKIMPDASPDYIERAAELAHRISINMETATKELLQNVCPGKDFAPLLSQLSQAAKIAQNKNKSCTTQLIVGLGEKDKETLSLSFRLYRQLKLSRCYYSSFNPIPQTPLEEMPPAPKSRITRLYQADSLIRKYHFSIDELSFNGDGNLPTDVDPKLAWAMRHPEVFPLEINKASYHQLIRVPGIGPQAALAIINRRKWGPIKRMEELVGCGVRHHRAAPFILINGKLTKEEIPLKLNLYVADN